MARRALRPIDPELDLSRHLLTLESLAQPLDRQALFGRTAPLEIEVGSGKGLFLSAAHGLSMSTGPLGESRSKPSISWRQLAS